MTRGRQEIRQHHEKGGDKRYGNQENEGERKCTRKKIRSFSLRISGAQNDDRRDVIFQSVSSAKLLLPKLRSIKSYLHQNFSPTKLLSTKLFSTKTFTTNTFTTKTFLHLKSKMLSTNFFLPKIEKFALLKKNSTKISLRQFFCHQNFYPPIFWHQNFSRPIFLPTLRSTNFFATKPSLQLNKPECLIFRAEFIVIT